RLEPPLRTTFAGREILGQSAWTQGPVLMQALGMLATFDLRALKHNSARYIHVVSEALKLAFADRERHYGDREDALASVAGLLAPELGCTLSTRSEMFVLEEDHPNALAPGKRPRTTLVSYLISEGGVPTMTVGCPGGDDQTQADLQLVLNLLIFGMNPQQAVEA